MSNFNELRDLLTEFIAARSKCDSIDKESEALQNKRMTGHERDIRQSELSDRERAADRESDEIYKKLNDWFNPYWHAEEWVAELDKLLDGKVSGDQDNQVDDDALRQSDMAAITKGLNESNNRCYGGEMSDSVKVDCGDVSIYVSWSSCQDASVYHKNVLLMREAAELRKKLNKESH